MLRHFSVLDSLVRSISSGEVTREDHEAVRRFWRFIREDRAIGREEALRYSLSYLDEKEREALGYNPR